jgi:hypothetical protein
MKHLFIPYNLALIAKEKGFNDPVFSVYYNGEYHEHGIQNEFLIQKNECSAPLYQQMVDWMREKHGIYIVIMPKITPSNDIVYYKWEGKKKMDWENTFRGYYEALDVAIEHSLTLI